MHAVTDKSNKIISSIIKHGFLHFNKKPMHDNKAVEMSCDPHILYDSTGRV
jgi:hypothetical protein